MGTVREAQARAERERDSAKPQAIAGSLENRPPLFFRTLCDTAQFVEEVQSQCHMVTLVL
jgi:hypothetical protein